MYAGADASYSEKYMDLPMSPRIVFTLINPLLEKEYCLFIGIFFFSHLELADALVDKETDCIETLERVFLKK